MIILIIIANVNVLATVIFYIKKVIKLESTYSGTAIGIKVNNGVVLASDKRYVYGNVIMSTTVKKTFIISRRVAAAAAGIAADIQELFREVAFLVRLREIRTGRPLSVRSVAKLTSALMYESKLTPFYTQVLIGGVVKSPELYSLDSLGSVVGDDYIVLGTGAEIAIGIIESSYKSNMPIDEVEKLVINALKAASKRDVLSGSEIDMVIITKDNIKEKSLKIT